MSPTRKPISQWKLMLIGRSSLVMRRLFVVILAVVLLVVWAIAIIGLGILGRDGGSPSVVRSAKASPSSPGIRRLPQKRQAVQAARPSVGEAELVQREAVFTAAAESLRNPFLADNTVFRPLQSAADDDLVHKGAVAATETKEATQEELEATRRLVESMMLISTVTNKSHKEAVIDGRTVRVNDKIDFRVAGRADSLEVVDICDGSVILRALGRESVLTVPSLQATLLGGQMPMAMIDGHGYRVGDRLKKVVVRGKLGPTTVETIVLVKEICNQCVILSTGGANFELTMRGVRRLREAETKDGQRNSGAVRATVEKE